MRAGVVVANRKIVCDRPAMRKVVAAITVVVVLWTCTGGGAAVPGPDGTITACYRKRRGALRVVDGTACKRNELPLSFGTRGPKGDAGAPGTSRAWAYVKADGTVVTSLSNGVAQGNVVHAAAGTYCFRDLAFTPTSAVASLAAGAGFSVVLQTNVAGTGVTLPGCGTDTSVFAINPGTLVQIDVPFFILLN
jgi:hypothetical protein